MTTFPWVVLHTWLGPRAAQALCMAAVRPSICPFRDSDKLQSELSRARAGVEPIGVRKLSPGPRRVLSRRSDMDVVSIRSGLPRGLSPVGAIAAAATTVPTSPSVAVAVAVVAGAVLPLCEPAPRTNVGQQLQPALAELILLSSETDISDGVLKGV